MPGCLGWLQRRLNERGDISVVVPPETPAHPPNRESEPIMTSYSPAFLQAVKYVLDHEAGYVDDPKDPGGATNLGITRGTLANWRGVSVASLPKSEVRNLSREEATAIYDEAYWDAARCDTLPPALAYAVFDFAVNSGPSRAVKKLQTELGFRGADVDGIVGGMTRRAIARHGNNMPSLVNRYLDARLRFMKRIRHSKTGERLWDRFGRGWQKRVDEVRARSLGYAGGGGSW